jgi:DUF438 domain-containing protein
LAKKTPSSFPLKWFEHLPCAVTVCDRNYTIRYLNEAAAMANAESGGKALIGKSLLDCHPPRARRTLRKVMASGEPHVFTTERKGVKKMVYEAHWTSGGKVGGMVEVSFQIPRKVRNLVRD